jgi:hypothetical protein
MEIDMQDLTIDQLRMALDFMERNYETAMKAEAYGLAGFLKEKIDSLTLELQSRTG